MNSTLPRTFVFALSFGFFAGCMIVRPHQEILPAVAVDCVVLDSATARPIPGASLQLIYVGPNGEHVTACEASTDQDGKALLRADAQTIRMHGIDWYFAGGYEGVVRARARGYKHKSSLDSLERVKISQDTSLKLSLAPIRNHYGAALVKAEGANGTIRTLTLQVLDGPQAGETVRFQFNMPEDFPSCLGKKLYFLLSISQIKAMAEASGTRYPDFENLIGEALHDEPYTEVIRQFGEITDPKELNACVFNMLHFIPGQALGTSSVTEIRAYTIATLDRAIDWLQFTGDEATLTTLRGLRQIERVPVGSNGERPGTRATECPADTPSWWTILAVPPVMEEYQYNRSISKERPDAVVRIWIDSVNRKVYAQRRWIL